MREFAEKGDFIKTIALYFMGGADTAYFFTFMIAYCLLAILVYFSFYKFYPQKQKWQLALGIFGASIVGVLTRYLLEEQLIYHISGYKNYASDYSASYYYFDNLYYVLLYAAIGTIFFFVQYSKYAEQEKNTLELENKKAELSFLRSQVNPHFLFNSLNNLYSLIYYKI